MSMLWASVVNAVWGISRASFAIRSSFVDTVMEPDVSAIFPSNVPVFRCSLPSTGSLGLVPPLLRYCEALRLPAAPPALLRFLRRAVPPLHLGLRSRGHKAQHPRARGLFTGFPTTGYFDGDDRTSQVPGGPAMNVPCSPTPVGPPRSATTALRCCLPPIGRRRLPRQILISGLNHTARTLAVYASQGGLPHRHARLASGGWPTLPGGTGYPPGPIERFQVIPSSFPRLRLAHPKLNIKVGQTGLSKSDAKFRGRLILSVAARAAHFPQGPKQWAQRIPIT